MNRYIRLLFVFFCFLLFFGCEPIIVGGICAAQYPFEKKPTFTSYNYNVSIAYIENGSPVKLNSSMQCAYKSKACNAAVGVYDKWESTFSNGESEFSIEKLSNNSSLILSKPDCKNAVEKIKEKETFGYTGNQSKAYSAVWLYTVNGPSKEGHLLSAGELKKSYGIENLVVEYQKAP